MGRGSTPPTRTTPGRRARRARPPGDPEAKLEDGHRHPEEVGGPPGLPEPATPVEAAGALQRRGRAQDHPLAARTGELGHRALQQRPGDVRTLPCRRHRHPPQEAGPPGDPSPSQRSHDGAGRIDREPDGHPTESGPGARAREDGVAVRCRRVRGPERRERLAQAPRPGSNVGRDGSPQRESLLPGSSRGRRPARAVRRISRHRTRPS